MKTSTIFAIIFSSALLTLPARSAEGNIVVKPADFEQFRDLAAPLDDKTEMWSIFIKEITTALRPDFERVVPGGTLELSFTELDRAGEVQPWRNRNHTDIRYFEELYFPHVTFDFVVRAQDGRVVASGQAHVRDMHFLTNINPLRHSSEFFFEADMLRRWVTGELRRALVEMRPLRAIPAMRTA